MPITASKNSGWILDSWSESTDTITSNPNEDVLNDDLLPNEVYQRIIATYQRHIVVQSPSTFRSAFGMAATSPSITSASGSSVFTPVVAYNSTQVFVDWKCVEEALSPENESDGTFRLVQTWEARGPWAVAEEFESTSFVPLTAAGTPRTPETDPFIPSGQIPIPF